MTWLLDDTEISDLRDDGQKQLTSFGDQRNGLYYHYTPALIQAVNVALTTTRPLLLCGEPGCGKSSMAFNLARRLNRRYYEQTISSRTQAHELLWQFDHIRRLADANVPGRLPDHPLDKFNYIEPGVLWWAFEPKSAAKRGFDGKIEHARDMRRFDGAGDEAPAVILIDEIDKAEPDVPNNLLEVIGAQQFRVTETGTDVKLNKQQLTKASDFPLMVITTNQERELPPAFIRRCIVYRFGQPTKKQLTSIAMQTLPGKNTPKLLKALFKLYPENELPQVAEFLDTLLAATTLIEQPGWNISMLEQIAKLTIDKQSQLAS